MSAESEQSARFIGAAMPGGSPAGHAAHAATRSVIAPWRVLCLCEVGNFPSLRRHLGRSRSDMLVAELGERAARIYPDMDARVTGCSMIELEFVSETPENAVARIDRLRAAFSQMVEVAGTRHLIQPHFGIAVAPDSDRDEVRMIEAAEAALDQARAEGRIVLLDLSRVDPAFDRLTLMRELPRAIAAGEMFLQYQPKVHIRRQQVASAEALVRWQHPTRGLILPNDFIAMVEAAGEIAPLTLWTLREVIERQRVLARQGHDFPIFINVSGVLLADAGFVSEACAIVRGSGVRIGFEITETAVIRDPESAIRHLKQLAAIGVSVAIDDYGAGLSSLAYLKQLPANELKIDKMFVMQLTSSNRDPLIVRSTIDLAHALEMEVTAEGVETPAALALLTVMGCDMVQGYLISRPLMFEAFCRFLHEEKHLERAALPPTSFVRTDAFWRRA